MPAFPPQERRDPAIAVAAVLTGEANDRRRQRVLIRTANGGIALGGSWLPQDTAGPAFRDPV